MLYATVAEVYETPHTFEQYLVTRRRIGQAVPRLVDAMRAARWAPADPPTYRAWQKLAEQLELAVQLAIVRREAGENGVEPPESLVELIAYRRCPKTEQLKVRARLTGVMFPEELIETRAAHELEDTERRWAAAVGEVPGEA